MSINTGSATITILIQQTAIGTNSLDTIESIVAIFKDQLISECPLDFQKKHRKIWQISALESKTKKLSNHKLKAHYNDFTNTYSHI